MMIFSEVIAKKMPIFSKYSICQPPLSVVFFILFSGGGSICPFLVSGSRQSFFGFFMIWRGKTFAFCAKSFMIVI